MISDLDFYKNKLKEEETRLEKELSTLAIRNPEHPEDWQPTTPELNPQLSDDSELADKFEEFDTQFGIETALEERLIGVKKALKRVAEGTYGKCEKCHEVIDPKRLNANPAAITCLKHADTE
ncbi:MAG: TraR/DksA C4-type zinc finger protein [Candidatus Niyogibacteria bacterium]|nr:TraR/DksA C4-type zinc finger protein [Candidatus Niyogibacteria bacterium]